MVKFDYPALYVTLFSQFLKYKKFLLIVFRDKRKNRKYNIFYSRIVYYWRTRPKNKRPYIKGYLRILWIQNTKLNSQI